MPQNLAKSTFWQQNRTVDALVSLIPPNSITQLMPNPFQIDSDMHRDIPKTKTPNILQNLNKIDISNHHDFPTIKQRENSSDVSTNEPGMAGCGMSMSTAIAIYKRNRQLLSSSLFLKILGSGPILLVFANCMKRYCYGAERTFHPTHPRPLAHLNQTCDGLKIDNLKLSCLSSWFATSMKNYGWGRCPSSCCCCRSCRPWPFRSWRSHLPGHNRTHAQNGFKKQRGILQLRTSIVTKLFM